MLANDLIVLELSYATDEAPGITAPQFSNLSATFESLVIACAANAGDEISVDLRLMRALPGSLRLELKAIIDWVDKRSTKISEVSSPLALAVAVLALFASGDLSRWTGADFDGVPAAAASTADAPKVQQCVVSFRMAVNQAQASTITVDIPGCPKVTIDGLPSDDRLKSFRLAERFLFNDHPSASTIERLENLTGVISADPKDWSNYNENSTQFAIEPIVRDLGSSAANVARVAEMRSIIMQDDASELYAEAVRRRNELRHQEDTHEEGAS